MYCTQWTAWYRLSLGSVRTVHPELILLNLAEFGGIRYLVGQNEQFLATLHA